MRGGVKEEGYIPGLGRGDIIMNHTIITCEIIRAPTEYETQLVGKHKLY